MKENEMSWEELLLALRTEYTLSFRDVCRIFKASRVWVNNYIKPYVRTIYLNNNRRGDMQVGKNWVRLAALELQKPMTENVWFHEEDLYRFVKDNIYSVTKRTKSVPVVSLMDKVKQSQYMEEFKNYDEKLENEKNFFKRAELLQKKNLCCWDYFGKAERELYKKQQSVTSRTKAEFLSYTLEMNIKDLCEQWVAPHDVKDYGDTDEEVYRKFFRYGYVRIELRFSKEEDKCGKKIYYLPDPHYIKANGEVPRLILAESDWQKYVIKNNTKLKK